MWVFLNDAFFSIVEDRLDIDSVVVRARVKGDLERTFGPDHEVIETEDSDYRFRVFLDRKYVADVMQQKVMSIDYDNFKNSIPKEDKERKGHYQKVWSVMNDWQEAIFGSSWLSSYLSQKYSYMRYGNADEYYDNEEGYSSGYMKGFSKKKRHKKSGKQKMYESLFGKDAFDEYGAR